MRRVVQIAFALLGGGIAVPCFAGVTCGGAVSGNVVLTADLQCTNQGGLVVMGDNTTIDLNGHTIVCTSGSSCGLQSYVNGSPALAGISMNGYKNVTIKGPGTISGFNVGVNVAGQNVTVTRVKVDGPSPGGGIGIWISQAVCSGPVRTAEPAFTITQNEVYDQRFAGISVVNASCGVVSGNVVAYSNSPLRGVWAISLLNTTHTTLNNNVLTQNGCGTEPGGGIQLANGAVFNRLLSNFVSTNCGTGIRAIGSAASNVMESNTARFNGQGSAGGYDMAQYSSGSNTWNTNNTCNTQGGTIPAGVCTPYE